MAVVDTTPAYIQLLGMFISSRITGDEFEKEFLKMWRTDRDSSNIHDDIVDDIFIDVDCYCSDESCFENDYAINSMELRKRCVEHLDSLKKRLKCRVG
jgi:hypothetical protein